MSYRFSAREMRGRTLRCTLIFSLCWPALACSRYDLVTTASGQTFRINRQTGEVALVAAAGVVQLPAARDSGNPLTAAIANRAHYWPPDTIPNIGVKQALLTTRCRNGDLHYRLYLEPVPKGYASTLYQPFTLRFEDDAGFALAEVPVFRAAVTRIVGADGRATALQVIGRVPLSADDCASMKAWSLLWLF